MQDLRDAVSFHQLLLSANGASKFTQRQYLLYECAFLRYLDEHRIPPKLSELNVQRVSEFLVWYRGRDHPRRSRGGEVAVRAAADILKRLAQLLEDNGYFDVTPLRKLRRPRIAKHTRTPFSQQEVSAMWGACFRTQHPARDEAMFLLLLRTGMRIGEACSLRMDHIDLRNQTVTVMGKGRRERTIPIGDTDRRDGGRVIQAIRRYLQLRDEPHPTAAPYLFLSRDRRRLTGPGGNELIKRIAALAGVENAYPHRLRHTFCTDYLTEHPGDEMGLRRIVGHISRDVLGDYVHLADGTIAQRVGAASIVARWLGGDTPKVRVLNIADMPILNSGVGSSRGGMRNGPAAEPRARNTASRAASQNSRRSRRLEG